MEPSVTSVYSSGFDQFYRDWKLNRDKSKFSVKRLVIVGGKFLDPPVEEIPDLTGPVVLKPEPDNEYDPNAVLVFYEGRAIGYVTRENARFVKETEWNQNPEWDNLPMLVNGPAGLYAVDHV